MNPYPLRRHPSGSAPSASRLRSGNVVGVRTARPRLSSLAARGDGRRPQREGPPMITPALPPVMPGLDRRARDAAADAIGDAVAEAITDAVEDSFGERAADAFGEAMGESVAEALMGMDAGGIGSPSDPPDTATDVDSIDLLEVAKGGSARARGLAGGHRRGCRPRQRAACAHRHARSATPGAHAAENLDNRPVKSTTMLLRSAACRATDRAAPTLSARLRARCPFTVPASPLSCSSAPPRGTCPR